MWEKRALVFYRGRDGEKTNTQGQCGREINPRPYSSVRSDCNVFLSGQKSECLPIKMIGGSSSLR
jgi:hypothetical protein